MLVVREALPRAAAVAPVMKFFLYDWPHLVNRYANYTDRDHRGHGVEFPQWTENYGAGRSINAAAHEFKTSQFGLFKLSFQFAKC